MELTFPNDTISDLYRPEDQCAKKLHLSNSLGEELDLTSTNDIYVLPEYGTYAYYFSLVKFPDIISATQQFTLEEPKIVVKAKEPEVFDDEMTIEDISDLFSEIDSDNDKSLTLTELSLYYLRLNLERGLVLVLVTLIEEVDLDEDMEIDYKELFPEDENMFPGVIIVE